jgi:TRAP-type C4-dicarboxylate transport system substrate-binding protein
MKEAMMFRFVLLISLLAVASALTADPVKVTVGGTAFPKTVGEEAWLSFERQVKAQAGDEFDLRMLIYGQLGSEEQLVSGLRRGRVHFANLSATVTSTVLPEIALLYAPYLFETEAEADYVYDNYLTDHFRELLGAEDLYLVEWNEIGFHHVYAKQPILMPADAQNKRFRVSAAPSARLFAQALGADVIPLGFGEIVSSLQTGLIEAGENGISLYARTGTAEEAPHLTLTGHSFGMSLIVSRKRWWDRLTDGQRGVLTRAFPSIEATRASVRAEGERDLATADELGFQVHRLTADQKRQWIDATQSTHAELIKIIGGRSQEIYDLIMKGRQVFREQQATLAR